MATVNDDKVRHWEQKMTFEKTQEVIEKVDNFGGFLLIRKLKPSVTIQSFSDNQIISDIITNKFQEKN